MFRHFSTLMLLASIQVHVGHASPHPPVTLESALSPLQVGLWVTQVEALIPMRGSGYQCTVASQPIYDPNHPGIEIRISKGSAEPISFRMEGADFADLKYSESPAFPGAYVLKGASRLKIFKTKSGSGSTVVISDGKRTASCRLEKFGSSVAEFLQTPAGQIYWSRLRIKNNGFAVERGLSDYVDKLGQGFHQDLLSLKEKDRWLDVGAGEANASLDYLVNTGSRRAFTVAVTADPRPSNWNGLPRIKAALNKRNPRFRYLMGKYIEKYSVEELGGQFQLITDVYGAFSYSPHVDETLRAIGDLMAVGGRFYTILNVGDGKSVHRETEPLATLAIQDSRGRNVPLLDWIHRFQCLELDLQNTRYVQHTHGDGGDEVYRIALKKNCKEIYIPALELVNFFDGQPPERQYKL